MNEEIEFLTLEDVLDLHAMVIEEFGGAVGIRDRGLLESAIAQPQTTFGGNYLHDGYFEMAAAYAFHIAQNQPFFDGNKRTGLLAALVFLAINGIELDQRSKLLEEAMIAIAESRMTKQQLAGMLQRVARVERN